MTSCGIDLSQNFVKLKGHISSKALSKVHYNQKASGHFAIPNIPRTISSKAWINIFGSLQWRHNGRDRVSNYRRLDCLLSRLFRRRSKKTSKLRVTGFYRVNSPVAGEFPAQRTRKMLLFDDVIIWRCTSRILEFHGYNPLSLIKCNITEKWLLKEK